MEQKLFRRNFVKNGIAASAGFFLAKPFVSANHSGVDAFSGSTPKPLNETLKTIGDLHTTHGNFSGKEIPDSHLDVIKSSCIRAANSSNMQTYSVVIVRDRKLMSDICGYSGSCLMLFNVDYTRLLASAKSLALPYYPGNMTSFITASINTALAAQTATVAARSLDIDSLLTNGIHRGNMERLWELLNLPEKYCMPLIALVMGYADKKPDYKTGRLSGPAIFHEGTYHVPTTNETESITKEYDDPDKHIGINSEWKKNGFDHYLQWLFKDWLADDSKPAASETALFAMLKKRGFLEV
ncbi:MAG TPA: hypothetical protein VK179_18655 [Bacteroidales bacterium]|nr:hypothetical protein [Bacteroidales bacterium]